jgi:hypothetical protein
MNLRALVNKIKIIIPITIALTTLLACNKNNVIPATKMIDPDPTVINYTSDRSSNLNVVYFIPSNKTPLANYQKRISGIMLHTQEWYKKEMNRNGFDDKTFGLLVDENDAKNVKIIVIEGENNANYYPYDGGGTKATIEIEKYFNTNPNETTSAHTVVFFPSR